MESDINSISSSNNSKNEINDKKITNSLHISESITINSDTQNSKNSEIQNSKNSDSKNSTSIKSNLNKRKFHINLKTPKLNISKGKNEEITEKKNPRSKNLIDKFNKVNESQISYDTSSKIDTSQKTKEKKI